MARQVLAEKATATKARAVYKVARAYLEGLKEAGCQDCGAKPDDLRKLHFHHTDPSTKVATVAMLLKGSMEALNAEIAKTVLVCESCHAERHRIMRDDEPHGMGRDGESHRYERFA